MENKNQIYLLSFIMYLVVGVAGYINQFTNYWVVLVLSVLITAYTLSLVFFNNKEVKESTKVEWMSVSAFCFIELILTIYTVVVKLPYVGVFKYVNYIVQVIGLGFAMYSIVRYVLTHTKYVDMIKEKVESKKVVKEATQTITETPTNSEVATEVEETIAEETSLQDSDVEIVEETVNEETESEVIGIEYKKEEEIKTPYMEEEI